MDLSRGVGRLLLVMLAASTPGVAIAAPSAGAIPAPSSIGQKETPYYLPGKSESRIVSVAKGGWANAGFVVLTQAVAVKESGPPGTVARFGEVYAFSPTFMAVHRNEPTLLSFWNLQPDDEHDLMLVAPDLQVLMHVRLPPLRETSYLLTFHREGLFTFYCTMHQPEMNGQILVLPPEKPATRVRGRSD